MRRYCDWLWQRRNEDVWRARWKLLIVIWAAGLGLLLPRPPDATAGPLPAETRLNDEAISQAVNSDLSVDEGVSIRLVDVNTKDGIVTLSGSVSSLLSKERAVRIAKSIRGVRAVVDELEVRPIHRTDRQIRTDILSALSRDPATESYEVGVRVEDGVVTLKGDVNSRQEKQLAAQVAKGVKGVKAVNNDLQWEWVPGRPDSEIRADIQQRLDSDIWLDDSPIDVTVNAGKVRLAGMVGSAMEQTYAATDAWVTGVKSVDDSALKVVPWMDDSDQGSRRRTGLSDRQIVKAVEAAFALDPRLTADAVQVTVSNGVATLTGSVGSLLAMHAAEEDVGNTAGVIDVQNGLSVRPAHVRTDAEIAKDIRNALRASPYLEGEERIRVQVRNAEAYLTGGVDSRFKKQTAGTLAAGVNGVAEVHNDLALTELPYTYFGYPPRVYPTWDYFSGDHPRPYRFSETAVPGDLQIKKRVKDQLFWSPYVNLGDVQVTVTNGVVTLSGTVHSRSEWGAAIDNAYQGGAVSVVNDLKLRPHSGS